MKDTLELKLSDDKLHVQLIGAFISPGEVEFSKNIDNLLRLCELALINHHEHYGEKAIIIDFNETTKITSVGFSVLEADVQELALDKNAQLKFINFPTDFKPSLETRALYYRLSEQNGVEFKE
ncbi:hypothetical protein QUF74_18810 [Candidatus Halobeggiatoa sp. HSG11]|nr:hypothetical protein [Candidatus Halobeggiatoa sp. HSG11]